MNDDQQTTTSVSDRDPGGLSAAEVTQRVADGRINDAGFGTSRSVWSIIKANVFTLFNGILGALFVLIVITGSWADALFGLVLVINSGIGIGQEYLAKRKLDRLALLNAPTTKVVRDGQVVEIPTGQVVADDLIELRTGDQVPADGVLLASDGLEVDESNLTGESDAVPHGVGDQVRSGTTVVAGTGRFFADAVGRQAYVNQIAAEARKFTKTRSEIQESVNKILKIIIYVIAVALPLQIISQARIVGNQGWREVVVRSAAGLVGLVPEGLVLLTSIAFLLAAVQLTRRNVLVQQLPAVEGLARVDVVCLDKTGTLTVGDIIYEDCELVEGADSELVTAALGALAHDDNANGTLKAIGAAIDAPDNWQRSGTVPFNSARKWSGAHFAEHGSWVLGAPDVLLPADHQLRERVGELARTGRRVLLIAKSDTELHSPELPADLIPCALVKLTEQIRPDAAETLRYFAEQGVTIKVISGDNPQTVAAIARSVGLEVDEAVDARTIGCDVEQLRAIAATTTVFGRVSPEQKRALVHALQADGHVVAMTGDGVNDALALKDADIGVAMGNGAQATKAIAELVLLDGKFSHLPSVLAEGRRVIGNIERVANLFLAKNVMSLIAIIATAIFFLPFPFLPRHLTLVSAVTIGIPAFVLALGPNSRRYVPGFLRRILVFALPAGAVAGITAFASYLWANQTHGVHRSEFGARCAVAAAKSANVKPDIACWPAPTAATVSLLIVFFSILLVLARPMRWWKAGLIGALVMTAVLAFVIPLARDFFLFAMPGELLIKAVIVGLIGAIAVQLVYLGAREIRAAGSKRT